MKKYFSVEKRTAEGTTRRRQQGGVRKDLRGSSNC